MNSGTRIAQKCGSGAKYFSVIDECVPLSIASTATFLDSFLLASPCTGGEMATQAQIEGIRYCNMIYGGLNITLNDPSADFSAFFDITTLLGLGWLGDNILCLILYLFSGPLIIANSSMTSLDVFVHLTSVVAGNSVVNVDGQPYGVVVAGLV